MYRGYLSLGGTEIINVARTHAYLDHQMPTFPLRQTVNDGDLLEVLEVSTYESPLVDNAPWLDPSDPATQHFYGIYPLSIDGPGGSTRSANVTEGLGIGGTVGEIHESTLEIRVTAIALARDDRSLQAGLTWLRNALGGDCGRDCGGAPLCFYIATPVLCREPLPGTTSVTIVSGSVSPSNSPLVVRFPPAEDRGQASALWDLPWTDGVQLRYGALPLSGAVPLFESDLITLQRTNFLTNPSFTEGLSGWSPGGVGQLVRTSVGGSDGGAFASLEPAITTYRTNWVANPSIKLPPEAADWTSNALAMESVAVDSI